MSGMTWLMPSLTTADAEKSKQLPGAPSTDARAPAYAIMCCCPLGGSIPGAPNRASGEALGVGGRRRRPANAGRGVQLLTQPTGGEGFGILSSDAYSLQAAPPASCSSRCGSGLRLVSRCRPLKPYERADHDAMCRFFCFEERESCDANGPERRTTQETPTAQRKENGTWTLQNSRQEARSQAGDWAPSKGVRGQKPSAVPAGRKGGGRNALRQGSKRGQRGTRGSGC